MPSNPHPHMHCPSYSAVQFVVLFSDCCAFITLPHALIIIGYMLAVFIIYIIAASIDNRAFGALSYYQATVVVLSQPVSWLVFLLAAVTVCAPACCASQPITVLLHMTICLFYMIFRTLIDASATASSLHSTRRQQLLSFNPTGSSHRLVSLCSADSFFLSDKVIFGFAPPRCALLVCGLTLAKFAGFRQCLGAQASQS